MLLQKSNIILSSLHYSNNSADAIKVIQNYFNHHEFFDWYGISLNLNPDRAIYNLYNEKDDESEKKGSGWIEIIIENKKNEKLIYQKAIWFYYNNVQKK